MDDVFDQDFIVSSLLSELKEENTRMKVEKYFLA